MISGSSAFSKASLNIWKFTVHVLLKPGLENFEHHFFTFTFHFHVTSLVAQMVSVCLQCRRPRFDSLACIGEGNDNPLQCSCLENPRDAGAWWAAIYGVTQSRTRLKRLSSSSSNADVGVLACLPSWFWGWSVTYLLYHHLETFLPLRLSSKDLEENFPVDHYDDALLQGWRILTNQGKML